MRAPVAAEPLGRAQVGAIELRVVRQLAALAPARRRTSASARGPGSDDSRATSRPRSVRVTTVVRPSPRSKARRCGSGRRCADRSRSPCRRSPGPAAVVAQIVAGTHAKRADRGQRAHLRSAQRHSRRRARGRARVRGREAGRGPRVKTSRGSTGSGVTRVGRDHDRGRRRANVDRGRPTCRLTPRATRVRAGRSSWTPSDAMSCRSTCVSFRPVSRRKSHRASA